MKLTRDMTLTEIMHSVFTGKKIEPIKRIKDLDHVPRGHRHVPVQPRYIWHSYPIKGGITATQVMAENITGNNALFTRLKARLK